MSGMVSRVRSLALCAAIPALLFGRLALAADASQSEAAHVGTVKQLAGGAVLHLGPGTRIETGRTLKLLLGPPGSAQTLTQVVKLISGRLDIDIPLSKVPKTAVLLQAPHKVSAVAKGGHSIAIAAQDRVTVAVVDGDMLAASGNDWKTLPGGIVRGFVGNDPTPQEHAVPGVPVLGLARPILLAMGEQAPSATVGVGGVQIGR